jgi:hypothetical protein
MSITTLNDIVAGLASKQTRPFFKTLTGAKAGGSFQSAWLAAGIPAAGGNSPAYTVGSGYTCDKATTGAFAYTNAAVQNWLARMVAGCSRAGTFILADRLWSCSGMGYAISTYTVTTPGDLPARITDSGVGCELWVEQFYAAGAASGTLTCSYKNTDAATKTGVIGAVVSSPVIGQMQPVPLEAGDTGISQLISVANSASWISGSWGMTILKRIAEIELPNVAVAQSKDWAGIGLPPISADACLMLIFMADGTTPANVLGRLDIIDK